MANMKKLDWIAIVLLTIGGINWGLVAWLGFDLTIFLSFGMSWITTIIRSLVGVAGIYSLWFLVKQAMD